MEKIEQTITRSSYDPKKLKSSSSHKIIRSHKSIEQVDNIVIRLVDRYKSEAHIPLFRRVGWDLSEAAINNAMEAAARANSPLAYFITCMKRELRRAGK